MVIYGRIVAKWFACNQRLDDTAHYLPATGLGQFTDKVNVTHNDDWSSLASSAAKSGNEITSEYD